MVDKYLIDGKDILLLNFLLENSHVSSRELAKKSGFSIATVLQRVKRLQEEKIVKKYTLDLDYERLGYDVQALISMRISRGKLFEVEKKIAHHPNVFAVYDTTGDFDALVIVKFKTRKALDHFLKNIQTYDFVERTETKLILNTIKEKQVHIE